MQRERRSEIQVGVMVVVAIIILILSLLFFKRVSLNTDMVTYFVDMPAVEGLRKSDRVQVRGIRVGQVTEFEFLPGTVRVTMEVEDWVDLHEDAAVALVMKGLVGEILIEIEPGGNGPLVQPNHVFRGRNAASMLALGDKVNIALDEMTALSEEVRLFISQIRNEGQVVGSLATTQRTLLEIEGMIKENRSAVNELTDNLVSLTGQLDRSLSEGKLDSTMAAANRAALSIQTSMTELEETTALARTMLLNVQQGEGTVGRLLTDDTLYDRADSTLQSLDRLLDQLRRNPKAMFKASMF